MSSAHQAVISERPYEIVQITRLDQQPIPAPDTVEAEMLAPLGDLVNLQVWA